MYMLVIMVFATLVKYIGSGPLWNSIDGIYDNCKENWWTNLLYVNNFVHTDKLVCFHYHATCIASYLSTKVL